MVLTSEPFLDFDTYDNNNQCNFLHVVFLCTESLLKLKTETPEPRFFKMSSTFILNHRAAEYEYPPFKNNYNK